jgi:tetratricopeptide (TPR) repeat protein
MSFVDPMAHAALAALNGKDYQDALNRFDQCISTFGIEDLPTSKQAWIYAHRAEAACQLAQSRHKCYFDPDVDALLDEAEVSFNHALQADPAYAWAWAHLGELCRYQANRFDALCEQREQFFHKGIDAFQKATEHHPKYAWAHRHWGALLANHRSNYDQALVHLQLCLKLSNNRDAWAYANLIICYYQQGDMPRAFNALFCAISIDPLIFQDTLFPASHLHRHRTLSLGDQFKWALRLALYVEDHARIPEENDGPLKGFYRPFEAYCKYVHLVFSRLADGEAPPGVWHPAPEVHHDPTLMNEYNYRTAGLAALEYKVRLANSRQGCPEDKKALTQLKAQAAAQLTAVVENIDLRSLRGRALTELLLQDMVWHGLKVSHLVPDKFKQCLSNIN